MSYGESSSATITVSGKVGGVRCNASLNSIFREASSIAVTWWGFAAVGHLTDARTERRLTGLIFGSLIWIFKLLDLCARSWIWIFIHLDLCQILDLDLYFCGPTLPTLPDPHTTLAARLFAETESIRTSWSIGLVVFVSIRTRHH